VSVRDVAEEQGLGAARGDAVVVIPVYGGHEHFTRCLASVLQHTPPAIPILVADDASPDPASRTWAEQLPDERQILWLRQRKNQGFVGNCNAAFEHTAPADVVLVNSDVVVSEGWFEGLRDAAYCDSTIATATALTNHGSILSVPYRNTPIKALPQGLTVDEAARRVRAHAGRIRPRIPTAVGHCTWIRRSALDLVGGFDPSFAPAYGEEVDFSQRCLAAGLQHVAADDVFVLHHGHATLGIEGERNPMQVAHEEIINARYRYFEQAVEQSEEADTSPLSRAVGLAARAMLGLSVTVDGRCLTPHITGTQLQVIEVIAALARTGAVQVRVAVPPDLGDYAQSVLQTLDDVVVVPSGELTNGARRTDIVHRPFQVTDPRDLTFLSALGDRLIVTNQDLIAYRNPSYFRSGASWLAYRRLTAETMALSSVVIFISEHARRDALADDLVPESRTRVVHNGVDHVVASFSPDALEPAGAAALRNGEFLLCLGTTFRHKNRLFALRLLQALHDRHGWEGALVLAGPEVAYGSSTGIEAEWLGLHPDMAQHVVTLPAMTEAEKRWLYEHCTAVVYPTTYEGFGLVPFEAVDAGKPCLFADVASLGEVVPADAALLVPWDADESADRVIDVLRDPRAAERHLEIVRRAARELTWDAVGQGLVAAYEAAMALPASEMLRLRHLDLAEDARYWHFRHAIGPTGLSLVEPDQQLLPKDVQRAVASLARRPATRGALFAGLRGLQRVAGKQGSENERELAADEAARTDELDEDLERLFPEELPRY